MRELDGWTTQSQADPGLATGAPQRQRNALPRRRARRPQPPLGAAVNRRPQAPRPRARRVFVRQARRGARGRIRQPKADLRIRADRESGTSDSRSLHHISSKPTAFGTSPQVSYHEFLLRYSSSAKVDMPGIRTSGTTRRARPHSPTEGGSPYPRRSRVRDFRLPVPPPHQLKTNSVRDIPAGLISRVFAALLFLGEGRLWIRRRQTGSRLLSQLHRTFNSRGLVR